MPPNQEQMEEKQLNPSACHWMPCSIDYDGLAPTHQYFQPEYASMHPHEHEHEPDEPTNVIVHADDFDDSKDENSPSNSNTSASTSPTQNHPQQQQQQQVMAASFRGRGVLSQNLHALPDHMVGCVYTKSERTLQACDTFRNVIEWEHEWDPKQLIQAGIGTVDGEDGRLYGESSVQKGLALVDLLQAVHDPIPTKD
jgi:hypothetical protein